MNKNTLVIMLAIGTITGILIASLSYTNTTYASTFQQRQACADKYSLRTLRNMISVLEQTGLRILIDQNDG